MGSIPFIYKDETEKLIRSVISKDPGLIGWTAHCKEEMLKDLLIVNDLVNFLKNGKIKRKAEFDHQSGIKLITCWRK